jgi:predicted DNA-binding protein (UPF0251 family)
MEHESKTEKLTQNEALALTGYSRSTLYRKRKNGELKWSRDSVTGRLIYLVTTSLESLAERKATA